jgi:hypothetical protein
MSRRSLSVKSLGLGWRHQVNTYKTFIAGFARSAVRMAVCSYCQRIKPFRPVKAVVVEMLRGSSRGRPLSTNILRLTP